MLQKINVNSYEENGKQNSRRKKEVARGVVSTKLLLFQNYFVLTPQKNTFARARHFHTKCHVTHALHASQDQGTTPW